MKGAILFSSRYGSTEEYAKWISDATGLPYMNIDDQGADPSKYDFLVLGSPIYYYKVHFRKWLIKKSPQLKEKQTLFFTVSGAPGGEKLKSWIAKSEIPLDLVEKMKHVALRGRQIPSQLGWFEWIMLRIAAMMNDDPKAKEEELKGFDYMDKSSIEPIVKWVKKVQRRTTLSVV